MAAKGDGAAAVQRLVTLLDVERLDLDLFRTPALGDEAGRFRLFGGQVAGQSLRAATCTVDGPRQVHSLHCYFLRPGDPGRPLFFYVDRSRDGRSFTTRHVAARQGGETIFEMIASFQMPEPGADYGLPAATVPSPEGLPVADRSWPGAGDDDPFELVELGADEDESPRLDRTTVRHWIRARAPLPEDPGLHAAVLAYLSDMQAGSGLFGALPWDRGGREVQVASLDHAMWFHRPMRADGWLLANVRPLAAAAARGFVLGTMHDGAGQHGVTYTQELLVRERRQQPGSSA